MNIDKAREPIHAKDSNLAGSGFSNVNLQGAVFDNINLSGGAFHNVNLTDVRITAANTKGGVINGLAIHELVHAACADAGGFAAVMPVLKVADLQRSIDWYCGLLGMTLLWRKPMDGGGENCMLRHGVVTLMLSTGGHLGGKPGFTGTLYFNMADVAALHERVKGSVEMVWPLEVMSYGATEFGVRDPDGYVVAFASHEPERRTT